MTDQTPTASAPAAPAPDAGVPTTARTTTALVFGAAVTAVLLAGSIVSSLSYVLQDALQRLGGGDGFFTDPASGFQWLSSGFGTTIVWALVVGVGVFLSLRFFRPVSAGSSLKSVLLRGLVAVAAATVAATLASFVMSGLVGAGVRGSFFGNSFPVIDLFSQSLQNFAFAIAGIPERAVNLATTILLVTVLGWLWLRRTPLK